MSTHDIFGVRRPDPHTEAKLFNAARRTATLLVEGEFDARLWRGYCVCRVWPLGGRGRVLSKLDEARTDSEVRFVAVLDADLDRLEGGVAERDDVVWTDAHDLESTLSATPALEKLLRHALDPQQVEERESAWGESFRERLYRHAIPMGRLRWLSIRAGLGLKWTKSKRRSGRDFDRFDDYGKCVDGKWVPAAATSVERIVNYSQAHSLKSRDLVAECEALPDADPDQVCNGHDLIGFLCVGVEKVGRKPRQSAEVMGQGLALAVERRWLEQTAMWRSLAAWAERHPGYRIFSED